MSSFNKKYKSYVSQLNEENLQNDAEFSDASLDGDTTKITDIPFIKDTTSTNSTSGGIVTIEDKLDGEDIAYINDLVSGIDDLDERVDIIMDYIEAKVDAVNLETVNFYIAATDDEDEDFYVDSTEKSDKDDEADDEESIELSDADIKLLTSTFPEEMNSILYVPAEDLDVTIDDTEDAKTDTNELDLTKNEELKEAVIRKRVFRHGMRKIIRTSSRPGYKIVSGREVRMSPIELRKRIWSARKAGRRSIVKMRRAKTVKRFAAKYRFMHR